jgi:COP9 signalosome complex subunit 2
MSDDDNMMDDEDYEFDYEDSDQDQDDGQVDMENEYYTAKGKCSFENRSDFSNYFEHQI